MAEDFEDTVEYAADEARHSRANMFLQGLFGIVYVLLIAAYAWQTYELVSWLFPGDNWPMKVMGVFVCDGCAIMYAAGETFYKFKFRKTFNLVGIMWAVTFIMSTLASAINLYLTSSNRIPHSIDDNVLSAAYIVNIVAFVANIVALTFIFRWEWMAGKPKRVYLDDGKPKRKMLAKAIPTQVSAKTSVPIVTQASSNGHSADVDHAAFLESQSSQN